MFSIFGASVETGECLQQNTGYKSKYFVLSTNEP